MHRPEQIISGLQTGADQGGLYGAEDCGIATGGMAPRNYRTQAGPRPDLGRRFGLDEHPSWKYPPRTEVNVMMSDGTAIFGNPHSPGCTLTAELCLKHHKPCEVITTADELRAFVVKYGIKILNIAGNREETNPGIFERTRTMVVEAFGADHAL
jgi:hypothetical protein